MLHHDLSSLQQDLRQVRSKPWELDDTMGEEEILKSPCGWIASFLVRRNPKALRFVVLYAMLMALPAWFSVSQSTLPADLLEEMFISFRSGGGVPLSAGRQELIAGLEPNVNDCRWTIVSCCRDILQILSKEDYSSSPVACALALAYADIALEHLVLDENMRYREWLIEILLPASLELRFLTREEAHLLRSDESPTVLAAYVEPPAAFA